MQFRSDRRDVQDSARPAPPQFPGDIKKATTRARAGRRSPRPARPDARDRGRTKLRDDRCGSKKLIKEIEQGSSRPGKVVQAQTEVRARPNRTNCSKNQKQGDRRRPTRSPGRLTATRTTKGGEAKNQQERQAKTPASGKARASEGKDAGKQSEAKRGESKSTPTKGKPKSGDKGREGQGDAKAASNGEGGRSKQKGAKRARPADRRTTRASQEAIEARARGKAKNEAKGNEKPAGEEARNIKTRPRRGRRRAR